MKDIDVDNFQRKRVVFSAIQLIILLTFCFAGFWKTVTVISICLIVINLSIELVLYLVSKYQKSLESKS